MQFLPITAGLDRGHEDVFAGHERQLGLQVGRDGFLIHDQAACDVNQQVQDAVDRQERLGQGQPTGTGIIECSLQPLLGSGHVRRLRQTDHEARQATDPFASHRVALVRHRGGADLVFLKWFLDLFSVGQQPDIGGELLRRRRDRSQAGCDQPVEDARIGLAGDRESLVRVPSHLLRDQPVELFDFFVSVGCIAAEQRQERGLRPGGPFNPAEFQRRQPVFDFLQRDGQVLRPERGPLADGGGLSRLIVGEAQGRQCLVPLGKTPQPVDRRRQFFRHDRQCFADLDQFGIAVDELTGRAEVDDRPSLGRDVAQCVDVSHHIVAQFLFVFRRLVVVDVVEVGAKFCDLFLADVQSQFPFRLRQRQPEATPGGEAEPRRPDRLHPRRCVTG